MTYCCVECYFRYMHRQIPHAVPSLLLFCKEESSLVTRLLEAGIKAPAVCTVDAFFDQVQELGSPHVVLFVDSGLADLDLEALRYQFETVFPRKVLALVLWASCDHAQAHAVNALLDSGSSAEGLKISVPWAINLAEARAALGECCGPQHTHRQEHNPLMGSVLHNLNNILGVLMGYIDISSMRATDASQKDSLEVMKQASQHMNGIFKNLGKLFLEHPYAQRPIKLEYLIAGAFREVQEVVGLQPQALQGLTIDYVCDPATLVVTHGPLFVKTLGRVLKNAYESYSEDTPVAKRLVSVQANVVDQEHGQQLRIQVKDAGPGLDPSIAEKPYEAFTTTKSGHKGLGLALGRQAMRSLGGQLIIQPHEPHGVTVTILQPFTLQEYQ